MPIFVFLRSSLFFGARQRPVRQTFDFRPFPAARRAESRSTGRRSLSASLRPSPTIYDPRARAMHVAAEKLFALLVSYTPLALVIFGQGRNCT